MCRATVSPTTPTDDCRRSGALSSGVLELDADPASRGHEPVRHQRWTLGRAKRVRLPTQTRSTSRTDRQPPAAALVRPRVRRRESITRRNHRPRTMETACSRPPDQARLRSRGRRLLETALGPQTLRSCCSRVISRFRAIGRCASGAVAETSRESSRPSARARVQRFPEEPDKSAADHIAARLMMDVPQAVPLEQRRQRRSEHRVIPRDAHQSPSCHAR
jgi:hypothetical protein